MRIQSYLLLFAVLPFAVSCMQSSFTLSPVSVGGYGSNATPTPFVPTPTPVQQAGKNIVPVTVGSCGTGTYLNEPCVSVTICTPGTTTCQTIPNILLDTGSYGLRIFNSRISVPLTNMTDAQGRQIAECAQFVIGADWGPVKMADVILGQENPARVPIQVIDASFPGLPTDCQNPDVSPEMSGYNGILGVGLFIDDCGATCATNANNRVYFACQGATCTGTTVAIANQVSNPVGSMSQDNNGVVVVLPALSGTEASSAQGVMYLGVGTQQNNSTAGLRAFTTDGNGYISANFNGVAIQSAFLDSGTNTNAFPSSTLTLCPAQSEAYGFFCPATPQNLNVTLIGRNGTQVGVPFTVANADPIIRSRVAISTQVGSQFADAFDFGLPFFFGRRVVTVIEGRQSSLGVGPLVGF